eukprot:Sdes_comp19020_c0_seq2m9570
MNAPESAAAVKDPFRDTFLRYAGYANEVGESFKHMIPKSVYLASYAVSSSYVLGDAFHKGYLSFYDQQKKDQPIQKRNFQVANSVMDVILWQTAASVVIPGFTINRIVFLTK